MRSVPASPVTDPRGAPDPSLARTAGPGGLGAPRTRPGPLGYVPRAVPRPAAISGSGLQTLSLRRSFAAVSRSPHPRRRFGLWILSALPIGGDGRDVGAGCVRNGCGVRRDRKRNGSRRTRRKTRRARRPSCSLWNLGGLGEELFFGAPAARGYPSVSLSPANAERRREAAKAGVQGRATGFWPERRSAEGWTPACAGGSGRRGGRGGWRRAGGTGGALGQARW